MVYVVIGGGYAVLNAPVSTVAVSSMPRDQAGVAAAVASSARNVGIVFGIAVLGAIVNGRVPVVVARGSGASAAVLDAFQQSYVSALHIAYAVAAVRRGRSGRRGRAHDAPDASRAPAPEGVGSAGWSTRRASPAVACAARCATSRTARSATSSCATASSAVAGTGARAPTPPSRGPTSSSCRRPGLRWRPSPASDARAERGFCAECGSSLFWRAPERPTVSVAAGTLDGPTGLRTIGHIYDDQRADWEHVDDLPRRP